MHHSSCFLELIDICSTEFGIDIAFDACHGDGTIWGNIEVFYMGYRGNLTSKLASNLPDILIPMVAIYIGSNDIEMVDTTATTDTHHPSFAPNTA